MATLVEIGTGSARRFTLGERATIGRDEGSTVRVDDPLVGARHAEIRRTPDGRFELVDLGSRRGTFVGDRRVSSCLLTPGDEILVGPARLRFEEEAVTAGVTPGPVGTAGLVRPTTEARRRLRRSADVSAYAAVELTAALESAADLPSMLEALLSTAISVVRAERGAVLLMAEGESSPSVKLARDRGGRPAEVTLSASLLGEVVAGREGVLTADALDDPRLHGAMSLISQQVRSALAVPLVHHGEQLGVLQLDSGLGDAFGPEDLRLVGGLARQASVAIRSTLLARKVDAAARTERERLERLLADLPDGVVLVEADGRIAFANPHAPGLLAALGASADEGSLERVGEYTLSELVARREFVEIAVGGAGGGPGRVLLASARETGGAGAVLVILRDVTREREREARAAQQERLAVMGQLAAGVAHDFNNILAVIENYAQFVLDELADPAQREDLSQVIDASHRAAQLVKQLLALSRREAMHPEVVRLDAVVTGLERLLRGAVGAAIELRTEFIADPWRVWADPSMLQQVVLNLAVNARDAMPGGGVLRLRVSNRVLAGEEAAREGLPAGRYSALEVADTGTGIPAHVVPRIFEPFFTTKPNGRGTGLGLATAYGIVHQAGGTIAVHSREGAGSTFTVYLPATDEREAARPEVGAAALPRGGTVLLAEDELLVRKLTRRILDDAGFQVLEAASGTDALQVAAAHAGNIDLLLTDVVMPGMSGTQLAKALRAVRPGLKVVYMSGYFEGRRDLEDALITKPFSRLGLLDQVRRAMESSPGG